MRGAAMSLTAAASGLVVFLLSVSVVQGQDGWGVTYTSTKICAVKGSTVEIRCSYKYPSTWKGSVNTVQTTFWFTKLKGGEPVDLTTDSEYAGRVEDLCENNICTLRIKNLRESDSAEYRFRIETKQAGGKYTGSPGVTLSVTGDNGQTCNRVTYTERSICALKGSSVDISCTYSSFEDDVKSKFWFSPERSHQGQNPSQPEDLSEDSQYAGRVQILETERGRSTLRISDLRHLDSAQYLFKFKTPSFEWRSGLPGTTLTVTALQVQVIRAKVYNYSTEAELKCHSSCSPAGSLNYVWFKNGEKIASMNTCSYEGWFQPRDNISCAFEGHEDFPSPPVYPPKLPSVSVSPSAEIEEGSSVTLTCSSDANPAANYTWYKKNGNQKLPPLTKEPKLFFSSIQVSDSGQYFCAAENELGKRTSEMISVDVKYAPKPPSVSVSPSAEIEEGSSVTLTCSSDANPAANYTWYKKNQTLFQGTEGSYNFTSISSEDRGIYYCRAENQYGEINATSLFVDVQYAPKLPSVSVSPSAEIEEGSSVTLTCSSDANPAANYTWYKEDEDSPKASGQIFTITDFRAEHSGSYSCGAQNKLGRSNSTLTLSVVAGSWKLPAAVTIPVVLLAVISLSVFLWIRRKRASRDSSEPEERADNREECVPDQPEQQEDLQYASVHFSNNRADPLYSNMRAARPLRHTEQQEVSEYAAVKFSSAAPRARGQDSEEDPAALYSTTAATANSPVPAEKARKRNPEVAFVPKSKREQERH
ncbi:hypothetical protein NQZ68_013453 [Dissostichus eleginoides]|nr:hypothetical protein NQZ68_013453 [Dissostichus eleginoides]